MKNSIENASNQWEPCSPGLIKQSSLDRASLEAAAADMGRRKLLTAVGGGTAVLVLGGFAGLSLLGSKDEVEVKSFPLSVTCDEVKMRLQEFASNQLDEADYCKIDLHLKKCESCNDKLQMIYEVASK